MSDEESDCIIEPFHLHACLEVRPYQTTQLHGVWVIRVLVNKWVGD